MLKAFLCDFYRSITHRLCVNFSTRFKTPVFALKLRFLIENLGYRLKTQDSDLKHNVLG